MLFIQLLPNIMRITLSIFVLLLFISCSSQGDKHDENVLLESESGWQKEFNTYYEIGSDSPYTGQFVCNSLYNKVTIDFKNGKMDGDFVRLNLEGDTTEYMTYNNGRKTYQLNLQYEEGKVIYRETQIVTAGSMEDKQLFDKISTYMVAGDYAELDNYLNSTGRCEAQLNSLTKQFGSLNSIEITEIINEFVSRNKREEITARMLLKYEGIQLNVSFLVVKDRSGKIDGNGIAFKPVQNELIPDKKIVDILAGLDNASSNFTFLNTKVWPEQDIDMIYIQNYLIEKDGKKQIMNIWYKSDSNNKMMFNTYHITPQKRAFEGMHWN